MPKKTIKQRVEYYLQQYPETKDNDNKLLALYWYFEAKRLGSSFKNLWDLMKKGRMTDSKSIVRQRQQLQERNIFLRGKNYEKRKGKLKTDMERELGYKV